MHTIYGTQSSNRWPWKPGSFDRLNIRYIFPSNNRWGIPELNKTQTIPDSLVAWNDTTGIKNNPDAFIHFFLDDYRFESVWNKPERASDKLSNSAGILTPDFSVLSGMPMATQLYQVYRSRWFGCFMQEMGIDVIPTAQWAGPETFEFCFAGIPHGGCVAVSAYGIKPHEVEAFDLGLRTMIDQCVPSHLIVYGTLPMYVSDIDIRMYPTYWQSKGRG
jgi:hypothetical protein